MNAFHRSNDKSQKKMVDNSCSCISITSSAGECRMFEIDLSIIDKGCHACHAWGSIFSKLLPLIMMLFWAFPSKISINYAQACQSRPSRPIATGLSTLTFEWVTPRHREIACPWLAGREIAANCYFYRILNCVPNSGHFDRGSVKLKRSLVLWRHATELSVKKKRSRPIIPRYNKYRVANIMYLK
jgi:hypothetical protein